MSQPYMVALMSELLELRGSERVLEVGSGSGYQTAVLAQLAGELYTMERVERLLARALAVLQRLGCGNVHARVGDGVVGWRDAGPFERILVAAAAPAVPPALRAQLADNGILVMPVGPGRPGAAPGGDAALRRALYGDRRRRVPVCAVGTRLRQ